MRTLSFIALLLAGVIAVIAPPSARAQCPPTLNPPDTYPGFNDYVHSSTLWDPDGPGPQSELLVAGGRFNIVGTTAAANIAAWDGVTWRPLGADLGFDAQALAVYHDDLYAAGSAGNVARWTGSAWVNLTTPDPTKEIYAMTVYQDELIIAGRFDSLAGTPAANIIRWDGAAWHPLGPGIPGSSSGINVYALIVRDGLLIVGGAFHTAGDVAANAVATWDGAAWSTLAGMPSSAGVRCFVVDSPGSGDLYAGGDFQIGTNINVARWTGSTWVALGPKPKGTVDALAIYAGHLIAGGNLSFGDANIVIWDGAAWLPLGGGASRAVYTLQVFNDDLFAGGQFQTVAITTPTPIQAYDGAFWNGAAWRPVADGSIVFSSDFGEIRALAEFHGKVYAAGVSLVLYGQDIGPGIAQRDGDDWSLLTRFSDPVYSEIDVLTVIDDRLIAAGNFTQVGGSSISNLAAWDGVSWSPLAPGIPRTIYAVTRYQGELIVGGSFGSPGSRIAAWNGSQWHPLGGGLNGTVRALTVYNNELIAGGDFNSALTPPQPAYHIARWDGSTWRPLGDGGLNATVYAFAEHEGDLIVGGAFSESLSSSFRSIVAWHGGDWIRFGPQLVGWCTTPTFCDSGIYALTDYQGRLIAGGNVYHTGQPANPSVLSWNGSDWQTLAQTDGRPLALAVNGPDLVIAGTFRSLGGQFHSRWAALRTCPADTNCDGLVEFTDYLEFLNLYYTDDPRVDLTGDGVIDFGDYLEFLNHYDAGC